MSLCEDIKGKKTYTVVVVLLATIAAYNNGFIDETMYEMLLAVLGATGLATLRDGVNSSKEEKKEDVKIS